MRKNGLTKLIVPFRNFANVPKTHGGSAPVSLRPWRYVRGGVRVEVGWTVRRSFLEQIALIPLSRYWTRTRTAKSPTMSGFETQLSGQPACSLDSILTQLLGN